MSEESKIEESRVENETNCIHRDADGLACADCQIGWYKDRWNEMSDLILELEAENKKFRWAIQIQDREIYDLKRKLETKHGL